MASSIIIARRVIKGVLIALVLVPFLLLYTCASALHREVELPNGYYVGPSFAYYFTSHNTIRIRSAGRRLVVPEGVTGVQWDKDAVYGDRVNRRGQHRLFFYSRGMWTYWEPDSISELSRLLNARGLKPYDYGAATNYQTLKRNIAWHHEPLPGARTLLRLLRFVLIRN